MKSSGSKHVASNSERKSSKRGKAADGGVTEILPEDPPKDVADNVMESNPINEPLSASIVGGPFGIGSIPSRRIHMVKRFCSASVFTKIINKGILDFLKASDRSEFDTTVLQVCSILALNIMGTQK